MNSVLIVGGKLVSLTSRLLNRGHGSTWPGHIALSTNKNFIKDLLKGSPMKIILIAGTNGKTTTAKLIQEILEKDGKKVLHNKSGANLLNGIASTMLLATNVFGKLDYDYAVFEIDENSLPLALNELTPDYVVLLNLFRDQLDRYGEVNTIAYKWHKAIRQLPAATTLVLNANDPQISYLAKQTKTKVAYFGIDDSSLSQKTPQHASDSTYCLNCGTKLTYKEVYFSHLGIWECEKCNIKMPALSVKTSPHYPLEGLYNRFNTHAAVLVAESVGISKETITQALQAFKPAFGRQEVLTFGNKHVRLFLSKNPTSFNQSLRTIAELGAKHLLIILNDRVPDGKDISWIWDVDFEEYLSSSLTIHVSGDRCWDMAIRIKYAYPTINHVDIHERADFIVKDMLEKLPDGETLYILPTYSAMLEVRKVLTGKKIL